MIGDGEYVLYDANAVVVDACVLTAVVDASVAAVALNKWIRAAAIGNQSHEICLLVVTAQGANRGRHGAKDVVVFETEFAQVLQLTRFNRGHHAGELVVVHVEIAQGVRFAPVGRNGTGKNIHGKIEQLNSAIFKHTARHRSRKGVARKVNKAQILKR